jgi:hypothetical protein
MSVSIDVHKPSFLHHARVFLAGPGGRARRMNVRTGRRLCPFSQESLDSRSPSTTLPFMAFLIPSASGRVLRAILLIGGTLSPLISSPLQGSVPVDFHSLPQKGQEMSVQKVFPGLRSLRIRNPNTYEEFEVTLLELTEFPPG